jgi:hypothetical protein
VIPDVYCECCSLQLITFMTDDAHGVSEGEYCAYADAQEAGKADACLPFCPMICHSFAPVSMVPFLAMAWPNAIRLNLGVNWKNDPFKPQQYLKVTRPIFSKAILVFTIH